MKPGIKSSEFWLTALAQVVSIALMVVPTIAGAPVWLFPVLGAIGSVLTALGYQVTRAQVKKAEAQRPVDPQKPIA